MSLALGGRLRSDGFKKTDFRVDADLLLANAGIAIDETELGTLGSKLGSADVCRDCSNQRELLGLLPCLFQCEREAEGCNYCDSRATL